MPAVKYDYGYYNRPTQGQAKIARSNRAYGNTAPSLRPTTSQSTINSVRQATRSVASPKKKTSNTSAPKRQNHASIDIPIQVKKKVDLQKPQEMKLTHAKNYQKAHIKTENILKTLAICLLMAVMLFAVCVRYVSINEKSNQVNSLEKNLNTALALNSQLSSEIESKTDLSYIEKYAKYQLGMQKPMPNQIVRIAYNKKDKISTPEEVQMVDETKTEDDFLTRLFNDLKNLVD